VTSEARNSLKLVGVTYFGRYLMLLCTKFLLQSVLVHELGYFYTPSYMFP
jgi:hypothetical protein